jgi:hypothetical protein
MSDQCEKMLKPERFGFPICTSDVTCFDGNLACINIPNGAGLNQVLHALASAICDFTPPEPAEYDASDITYTGQTVFECFALDGVTNVEEAIIALATRICRISGDLSEITPCDILVCEISPDLYSCAFDTTVPANLNLILIDIINQICETNQSLEGLPYVEAGTGREYSGAFLNEDMRYVIGSYSRIASGSHRSWVVDGGVASYSGGSLSLTIDDGSGGDSHYVVDSWMVKRNQEVTTLSPNADNYVDIDSDGTYYVSAVGIAAPAPPVIGMRLFKFETSGVGVSVFTDLREFYAHDGSTFTDDSITTRHITNLSVTGAKLESIGAGATVGQTNFWQLQYDTKGRVTSASTKVNIGFSTALADGHILQYDLTNDVWKNVTIAGTLFPAGTNGQTLRYSGTSLTTSSFLKSYNSSVGVGVQTGDAQFGLTMGEEESFAMILKVPSSLTSSATTGGTLTAGTYYYVVQALDGVEFTPPSSEVSQGVDGATTTAVQLGWSPQSSATGYYLWRGTSAGVYDRYKLITGATTGIIDDGTSWTLATPSFPTDIEAKWFLLEAKQQVLRFGVDSTSIIPSSVKIGVLNTGTSHTTIMRLIQDTASVNDLYAINASASNSGSGDAYAFLANQGYVMIRDGMVVGKNGATIGIPSTCAALEMGGVDSGILLNRVTTAQKNAIPSPLAGLMVYDTTLNQLSYYNGTNWINV